MLANRMRGQNSMVERYRKLALKESLNRSYLYPIACKELASVLRNAYPKAPKDLQALIFQDLITAFTLLPQMQTQSCVSAANTLLQSAESSLPRTKRIFAMTEFKHGMVAQKRHSKAQQYPQGLAELPQDVLVQIFGSLDLQSLISASAVCRLWNAASRDYRLWESLYADFFSHLHIHLKAGSILMGGNSESKDNTNSKQDLATGLQADWRNAFKRACEGTTSAKKLKSHRGYCRNCSSIFWLCHSKRSTLGSREECNAHQIKILSHEQIVDYLLDGSVPSYSSSDSDSDSEDESVLKLWTYPFRPKDLKRYEA